MAFTAEQRKAHRAKLRGDTQLEVTPTGDTQEVDYTKFVYPVMGGVKYAKVIDTATMTVEQRKQVPGLWIWPKIVDLRPEKK